ncbi:hypothetical protein ACFE04_021709 [Oxalis oulophora]
MTLVFVHLSPKGGEDNVRVELEVDSDEDMDAEDEGLSGENQLQFIPLRGDDVGLFQGGTRRLVVLASGEYEIQVKDFDERLVVTQFESMLQVASRRIRDHTTPTDLKDKDIEVLVLVACEESFHSEAVSAELRLRAKAT